MTKIKEQGNQLENDLTDAYLKFKSYVYHENFSISLKKDIASFEKSFSQKISKLSDELSKLINGSDSRYLNGLIKKISYRLIPKKFFSAEYDIKDGIFYTNNNIKDSYLINDLKNIIPFINCPIELHIISTLWVIQIGEQQQKNLSDACFSNRLYNLKRFKTIDRLKLFKKYYFNYNKWRDSALKTAKSLHQSGNNVAILNLDVRSFYHSIDLDLTHLIVDSKSKWLNELLNNIHKFYVKTLITYNVIEKSPKQIIPIGLISSNILANIYLKDLDESILNTHKPAFYGRYVDDILFVFSNPQITDEKNIVSDFIRDNIIKKNRISDKAYILENPKNNFKIFIDNNYLDFQLSKIRLYYFKQTDDISLIEEFEKEIKRNSSEFRLQLEEEELINPFEEENVYQITYSDTINKLRSIDTFSTNKFGVSKQLSRIISVIKYLNVRTTGEIESISKKINDYFIGQRALELNILWEKAFIFFILNGDSKGLIELCNQLIDSISLIRINVEHFTSDKNKHLTRSMHESLIEHLINSFSAAAALDINFISTEVLRRIKNRSPKTDVNKILSKIKVTTLKKVSSEIVKANLFNHSMVIYPLINYSEQSKTFSYITKKLPPKTSYELNEKKISLSPRYINFHEVQLYNFLQYNITKNNAPEEYIQNQHGFNISFHSNLNGITLAKGVNPFSNLKVNYHDHSVNISSDSQNKASELKIGLSNIKVKLSDITNALKSIYNLSFDRLNSINKILNEGVENNVELIIFPEVCIPFQWLNKLIEFSKRNNIAIVCGLEHFIYKKEAFNYVCTILPFKDGTYNNASVDLRLKIDYSPSETIDLEALGLSKPLITEKMRLYTWRRVAFSVFNCFELTDIKKRSFFRGLVDVIFTVEYNKDVNYFSNIIESYARDIHSYVIQVNSSDYGDSRITIPASTILKDYIKIKGGENVGLLIGNIDIKNLRAFQKLSNKNQLDKTKNHRFKPVPPDYKMSPFRKLS
ncbi:MAG: reverse transcriptase domain-containing protein [Chitinophagaceae bacterium]